MLNNPQGAPLIEAGFRLAPADAIVCYVAGMLDAQNHKFDAAIEKFKRAIKLDRNLFKEIAEYCMAEMNQPDLAVQLAEDNIGQLSFVATILANNPDTKETGKQALTTIKSVLVKKCDSPDAPASAVAALAAISAKEANIPAAIEYYKRALAVEYGNVQWRFALARLLAEQGQNEDAIHEARICLRLRPAFGQAKKLIGDLSVK
jgi:tetratricopeptide (TPR) repeat protein